MYARQGIAEVWLEALAEDAIEIYRDPTPEGYRTIFTARRGESIAPLAFPDVQIAVVDLLG